VNTYLSATGLFVSQTRAFGKKGGGGAMAVRRLRGKGIFWGIPLGKGGKMEPGGSCPPGRGSFLGGKAVEERREHFEAAL